VFTDAFAEAAVDLETSKGDAGKGNGDATATVDQPKGQLASDRESTEKPEKDGELETVESKPAETKAKPSDEPSRIALLEQQYNTLQGMFRAEKEKWDQERTDLLAAKPVERTETKPLDFDETFGLSEDEKKELSEYNEEFDVVSKFEGLKRKAERIQLLDAIDSRFKMFEEALTSIASEIQKTTDVSHFGEIRTAHSDFETLRDSGEIKAWIQVQPKYLQTGLLAAYKGGSADEVIDMITRFKRETGRLAERKETKKDEGITDERKKQRLQNLTVVSDRKSPVSAETTEKDKNDFSTAFKEAITGIG
jgi:hypothetical protein